MASSSNPNLHYLFDDGDLEGSIEAPRLKPASLLSRMLTVDYTIGAESASITVSCQFNLGGVPVTSPVCVRQYLATAATGQALSVAPSGTVVAGTDGTILVAETAKLVWTAVSEADGDLDIVITEAGAYTTYLITVLPSGFIAASAAIVFAG